jgi:phospholipase/carboxylesterase
MTKLSGPMLAPANGQAPDSAVVLLHGYGSDGNDLIAMAPHFQHLLPGALFVSPHAPDRAGAMGSGFQWFPIDWDFGANRLAQRQLGVIEARPVIVDFLNDLWEQTGITPDRTLLVGFSQGAMMALHVGLSLPVEQTLMGVIGISGAFLPPDNFGDPGLAKPPVCLVHGDRDDVVSPQHSADASNLLTNSGFALNYHVSRGTGHGVSADGLEEIAKFIEKVANK